MQKIIDSIAPGAPGVSAKWTTSAKEGVGTSINMASSISFTLSHGIINEIYFPREDKPATRDMGFIVTNGKDFFSEEKRDTHTVMKEADYGVPAFEIINTCQENRYKIIKKVVTDTQRDTLIQRIEFTPIRQDDYQLYALLAPHLNNQGNHNDAWVGEYKGRSVLFAQKDGIVLAMVCSCPWVKKSVGYVGVSDGWQDINSNKQMKEQYDQAADGNIALTAEVDIKHNLVVEIAIGFGFNANEAAHQAIASLVDGYDNIAARYIQEWRNWHRQLRPFHTNRKEIGGLFRISASVLRTHQSKNFSGAMIASLSIPWGNAQGDDDESGYHLVWPRDLVESAGGLLALNAKEDVRNILNYLMATQEADGHWPQNMWLEGNAHWQGIQLDETAMPILLIDLCLKRDVIKDAELPVYWPAIRKAAAFLIRNGLISQQERWEEQNGISVSTVATMVAAMLAVAEFAEAMGEKKIARFCRETADAWNDSIDTWLYATGTPLCEEIGVQGYYLRINPTTLPAGDLGTTTMSMKNRTDGQQVLPIVNMVSTDPLALVHFGLRDANDERILNTIKVIDAKLKIETPHGACWYRYVNDGYGEQEDGSAYSETGIGRPWPLLTGERGHYEVAAGNFSEAKKLLKAMESFANNGLIPEQIWDRPDIPEKELFFGKHSNSAMPLVWAHSEHIKLVCSIKEKAVFDLPSHTNKRYVEQKIRSNMVIWRFDLPVSSLQKGKTLRIETLDPAKIKWTADNWKTFQEIETTDSELGIHFVDLNSKNIRKRSKLRFTFFWPGAQKWEGKDFEIIIV